MTLRDDWAAFDMAELRAENEKLRRELVMCRTYLEKQVDRALRVQKVIVDACKDLEKSGADIEAVARNLRAVGGGRG